MTLAIVLLAAICLASANGANDNFKGVATLFGSGTASYRNALAWATVSTFLGSLAAIVLSLQLLKAFSGRGLVPDALIADPRYLAAVGMSAGLTVLLATRLGMPVSTTHALVGALVGCGIAAGVPIGLARLQSSFVVPLLVSPAVAVVITCVCDPVFAWAGRLLGISRSTCFCVGADVIEVIPSLSGTAALQRQSQLAIQTGTTVECQTRYQGSVLGIDGAAAIDGLHYLSAGVVSFARGLNDTPKIAALLLALPLLGAGGSSTVVAVAMAVGGLLGARRVAETMSTKITAMNPGQGCTANLVTSTVVIAASCVGLPVSTTHVSCGALFGVGISTGQAQWISIARILSAWVTTLPVGALLGALCFWMLRSL
jgi:PiT family inorganic phosphate transporter